MNQIQNILYLGWLGKGNVGDDVLYELFKQMFYKYHKPLNKATVVNIDAISNINNYIIDITSYNLIVLGGGSLLNLPFYLKICEEGIKKGIPVVSWGTGVDGAYRLEHIDSINLEGANAREIISIYNQFDYISVRGPFSKNYLLNSGLENQVYEIGDPALAYSIELFDDKLLTNNNRRNIFINWGTSYNNIFGRNELSIEDELVTVIRKLLSRNFSVTIYPIWTEDIEPVKRLAQKVNDIRCQVITQVYEAKILQQLISQAYITINFKLHANILSASVNRPFISLAYRGKCFEFAHTVDCDEYALATDFVTSDTILQMVQDIENKYDVIVNRIKAAKAKYHPRLIESIQTISSILNGYSEGNDQKKRYIENKGIKEEQKDKYIFLLKKIKQYMNLNSKNYSLLEEAIALYCPHDYNRCIKLTKVLSSVIDAYLNGKITYEVFCVYLEKQFNISKEKIVEYLPNSDNQNITLRKLQELTTIPKVSVIITTYNREKYVLRAISSILNQDYKNLEIIVVDDCSTDFTKEMINNICKGKPFIKYFRNETNVGPSVSRKLAYQNYAEGEYILFLDDNGYLIDSNYITKAVHFHVQHPNISFVAANVFYEYTTTNFFQPIILKLETIIQGNNYLLNFGSENYPKPASTLTALFKRKALERMGITNMKMVNDSSIYLRSLLVGDAGFIHDIVGVYSVHGSNMTFNLDCDFIIDNLQEKLEVKNIAVKQCGYDEKEMDLWMERNAYSTISYYFTNSPILDTDIKKIAVWLNQNCPRIIEKIDKETQWGSLLTLNLAFFRSLKLSLDLSNKILEGITKASVFLNDGNLELALPTLLSVFQAFHGVKKSIDALIQHFKNDFIRFHMDTLQKALEQILNAAEEKDVETIRNIIQSTLINNIKELQNELESYLH